MKKDSLTIDEQLMNNGSTMAQLPFNHRSTTVHPTAIIDPGATIGMGTAIWHFSHVMPTAVIGEDCILGQNVFIGNNVVIGNRVKVQNNVSVYEGVQCENDVFIGPSVVFTNVSHPRAFIEQKDAFQKTMIRKGVTIGANATILCGIELGEYCFIGAGSVVTKDVPPFALMVGKPARQVGWVDKNGRRVERLTNNVNPTLNAEH